MNIIKSDIVSLHGAAISMIGGRPENQDDMAYLDTPLGFLIVVCDGMGGGPGGKTASYIVKHEIAETILECSPQTPRDHALKMAAARAHRALEDKMRENPALSGMGSTFVAVLLNAQSAVIAHSGDSRCYRLHGKKCLFRTQDHSLVAELVKKKVMTEEDARQSPQANVITRGLGSTNNHVPEIEELPYKKGDRFVLCTDGVWGAMRHQELLKVFTQNKDVQQLLSDLSAKVDNIGFSKGGSHDNHTVAMFEIEKSSQLKEYFPWKKWTVIYSAVVLMVIIVCYCLWIILGLKEKKVNVTSKTETPIPVNVSSQNVNMDFNYSKKTEKTAAKNETVNGTQDNYTETEKEMKGLPNNNVADGDDNQEDDTLYMRLLQVKNKGRVSVPIVNENNSQNQQKDLNTIEVVSKIAVSYESAKAVGGKTIDEAKKNLETKKVEIKKLFVTLIEQTKNSKSRKMVERISNAVDALHAWDIAKEPDRKSKLYVPTAKAQTHMGNQIERLKKLKKNLEKE